MRTVMKNIPASEYPKTYIQSYKMTTNEIKAALDEHDQIVSNLNKRILEILGNPMKFEAVAA